MSTPSSPYTVVFKPGFFKDLKKLSREICDRTQILIENIRHDPFLLPAKKLVGQVPLYRYRLGDYRLVYYVDNAHRKVVFLLMAHRKDVYRRLERLK